MAMMEFEQVKDAALKFDKPTLARMAQMGQMSPTIAVMAGMMRDRIVQSEIKPPAPPTVAEEVMQPMGQRMGAPQRAAGISQIPVREDMFEEPQGMASGGIVAFQAGGKLSTEDPRIAEVMKNLELRRRILGEDVVLKTEREGMDAAAKEQRAMRLIEAGLGIMGGESPYALQNISRGAQSALKGYGEDVAAQRKRKAELAGVERAEKEKALESVLKNEQALRQAALSKDTDLRDTTRIYFEAAVARGANPQDPRTMEAARRQAYADIGLARERLNVQEQGLTNAQIRAAMDSTEKDLKAPTNRLEMLKRQEADRKNGTNTADQYREQLFQENLRRSMGGGAPAAPRAAPTEAAPKSSAPAAKKPTIDSVRGAPSGAKIGNPVEGKGYEVLDKNGKVIGYAR